MKARKKIKDERIVQLNRRIQSETFVLAIVLLSLSIFVKNYILDLPVSAYISEILIVAVCAVYLVVRGSVAGYSSVDMSRHGRKLTVFSIVGLSLVLTVANGIRNYTLYGEKYSGVLDGNFLSVLAVTFISTLIFIAVVIAAVAGIENLGQKRIEKKLEDHED